MRVSGRACRDAGVAHYHPHDLGHRFGSLLTLAGVPLQLAKEVMGHTKASMTIDTYGHVLLDEPEWRLAELRQGVARAAGLVESSGSDAVPVPFQTTTGRDGP